MGFFWGGEYFKNCHWVYLTSNLPFKPFFKVYSSMALSTFHLVQPSPSVCNLVFNRNLLNFGCYCSRRCLEIKSHEYFSWSSIGFQDSFLISQQFCTVLMVPSFCNNCNCLFVKFLGELIWLHLAIKYSGE